MSVGALEPQFYAELIRLLGEEADTLPDRNEPTNWANLRGIFSTRFREKTRDEWALITEGTDACAAPILSMKEAPNHPHNRARGAFVDLEGVMQPEAAPQLSTTPGTAWAGEERQAMQLEGVLARWG